MSCRSTPYGSAFTTIARLRSGLDDVQTLSLYHAMRRGGEATPPSQEQWHQYLDSTSESIRTDTTLSEARRRSILSRLDASREVIPDGASWGALQNIETQAVRQTAALNESFGDLQEGTGWSEAEVRRQFNEIAATVDHRRGAAAPEGYTTENIEAARQADRPIDRATIHALHVLQQRAATARGQQQAEAPARVQRVAIDSSAIREAGYDPRGGHLEVVMHSNPEHPYYYRAVPPDVWERMNSGSAGRVFATEIRGNRAYQYENRETAVASSRAQRCGNCGQFATAGHQCPTGQAARTTTVSAPVVVEAPSAPAPTAPPAAAEPEPEPEPEPEAEPEYVTPATPEDRPMTSVPRTGRPTHIGQGHRIANADGRFAGANIRSGPLAEVQSIVRSGAVANTRLSIWSYRGQQDGPGQFEESGQYQIQGRVNVWRNDDGTWAAEGRDLRCTCTEYRRNYDCEHVRAAAGAAAAHFAPGNRASVNVSVEDAQAAADRAALADWSRTERGIEEARRTWAPADPEDTYSTNFAAFETDMQEALERKNRGEAPIEYQTENVLGGWCPDGGDEGFGVELEFDLPNTGDKAALKAAIGRDLYEAGLTAHVGQQWYHAGARTVHHQHDRGWRYEADCTVDGEIISPVMRDTPETWQNIAKVCDIVKRHGGKATVKAGSHVHVSAPNLTGGQAAALLHTVNQHEDVLYRLSQNPERGKHRSMTWCGPNGELADGVRDLATVRHAAYGHNSGLNLQHVRGSAHDHPEIRHWDGTLDPAVIQTQVKMSVAMVQAARRNAGAPARRNRERVGTHATMQRAVLGSSRRALTSEELATDSATARSFIDTLFTRREDKKQIAALYAITKWHKA